MSAPIFADVLSSLTPGDVDRLIDGPAADGAPSNQQIINACRAHYAAHQPAVDAMYTSSNGFASTDQGKGQIAQLNAHDWKNNGADVSDATNVKDNGIFGPALSAANADTMLTTVLIGISAGAQLIIGGEGGIGVAWDLLGRESAVGAAFAMFKVGLEIDSSINIMGGGANALPSALGNATFYGLQVSVHLGLGAELNIFTTQLTDLTFLGFSVGIGVGLSFGASVFAGHFYTFG